MASDQWDEMFGPGSAPAKTQPTGAAPKETTAKPKETAKATPKPDPVPQPAGDDDFDFFESSSDNAGDPDDQPGDAATVAQAKETLAGILTEEKKPVETAATEPKKRGRKPGSKNADKPLTADEFVDKMKPENAEGNRTAEETFRQELGSTLPTGTTNSEQEVARAIATLARFIASAIRAGV
jgi:hypothetical protein